MILFEQEKSMGQKIPEIKPKRTAIPRLLRYQGWYAHIISRNLQKVLTIEELKDLMQVEGHLSEKELLTLFYYAFFQKKNGLIVEIGSFKGKSAVCMATALKKAGRPEKVIAIDPHINTHQPDVVPAYQENESYQSFLKNLSEHQVREYVEPIRATSQNAANGWNRPIRLLFIDGSHRYEDVLLDIQLWERWLIRGGILIFHDTGSGRFPGVTRAIQETIVPSNRFHTILCLSNMTVFEKRR